MLAVDPSLFAEIHGSTDTEVVFYLALTFGLEDDPIDALERTVGAHRERGGGSRSGGRRSGDLRSLGRRDTVGRPVLDGGPRALSVRFGGRRRDSPAAPGQPALPAPRRRRPPDRLGAVLRPPGRLARDPGADGGHGAPRRGARGAAVPAAAHDRRSGFAGGVPRRSRGARAGCSATGHLGGRPSLQLPDDAPRSRARGRRLRDASRVAARLGSGRWSRSSCTATTPRAPACRRCASAPAGARASCWMGMGGRSTTRPCVRPARTRSARGSSRVRPARAVLEVGELALADGVPFELDGGGFGRHTFLCGQSGSGQDLLARRATRAAADGDQPARGGAGSELGLRAAGGDARGRR